MIIIHHLNNSRSQRILWLLEELGADYEIKFYQRNEINRAPPELKQAHPLGKSPIIEDGNFKIAESGAAVDYLIRTYAWIVLLNREGLINKALSGLGLTSEPLSLLYTDGSVIVGLLYAYLPFMILTLYASIARLDPALREASADLGGSSLQTHWHVILPLCLPGIAAGCVFVFVLSIGNFITPDLLGGGRRIMVGNLIYDQFLSARDWPFGASLAFILIGIMMLLLLAQAWLVNRQQGGRMQAM